MVEFAHGSGLKTQVEAGVGAAFEVANELEEAGDDAAVHEVAGIEAPVGVVQQVASPEQNEGEAVAPVEQLVSGASVKDVVVAVDSPDSLEPHLGKVQVQEPVPEVQLARGTALEVATASEVVVEPAPGLVFEYEAVVEPGKQAAVVDAVVAVAEAALAVAEADAAVAVAVAVAAVVVDVAEAAVAVAAAALAVVVDATELA